MTMQARGAFLRDKPVRYHDNGKVKVPVTWSQLLREVERLRELIRNAYKLLYDAPELNMGNYTDDQVGEINNAVIQACSLLEDDAKESPA